MPTGYTAGILDGKITTFPQFGKLCMRAFGATIHLRDESLDTEYEQRLPSDYHLKEAEKAKQLILDAETLTDEVIFDAKMAELETSKKYHLEAIEKAKKASISLNKILLEVRKWQPPTDEHTGIKEFMIDQIIKTLNFDCKTNYHDEALVEIELKKVSITPSEIRKEILADAKEKFSRHSLEYLKEVERCEKANKWVNDFLESVA